MEEIEELRAKVFASMSASGNPNPLKRKALQTKEEGELSSSGDEALRVSSAPSNTTAAVEPPSITLRNIWTKSGNSGRARCPPSLANMHLRKQNYNKQMKGLPFKSQTSGWHTVAGSDDNLVISFSDDDTDSNSEESKPQKESKEQRTVESEDNTTRSDRFRRPLTTYHPQSEVLQRAPNDKMKMLPKTVPVKHPSIQVTNSRGSRPSSVDHVNKSREDGYIEGVSMADNELEGLRQQIALRENELKLQNASMPESRERIPELNGETCGPHGAKPDTQAPGMGRPINLGLAPNNQETKRLKLEHTHDKLYSDGQLHLQMPSIKSVSEIRRQVLENSVSLTDRNVKGCHHCTKEFGLGVSDSVTDKRREETNDDNPISSGVFRAKTNDKEPFVSVSETVSSTISNLGVPSKQGDQSTCGQFDKRIMVVDASALSQSWAQMIPNVETGLVCLKKTPSPKGSASQHDASPINFPFHLKPSGPGSMEMESLIKLEDLQDKELEEAQELRHMCELEERRALKAYHKAQRALIEANDKCSFLYRRRELFSAQIRAFLMEGSSSLWSSSWPNPRGTALDSIETAPKASNDVQPIWSHQVRAEDEALDHGNHENNVQCTGVDPLNTCDQQMNGLDLRSEQCFEPDTSTLDPKENDLLCDNQPDISTDDNKDNCPHDIECYHSRLPCDSNGGNIAEKTVDVDIESERKQSLGTGPDYELLEASLRSKLVARLGVKSSSNSDVGMKVDTINQRDEKNKESNTQPCRLSSFSDHQLLEDEKNKMSTIKVDPLWPLCMFELRGKCNNEECSWQHLKDRVQINPKQIHRSASSKSDGLVILSSTAAKFNGVPRSHDPYRDILSIPTYRIGSNLIRTNMQLSGSVLAGSNWSYWEMGFCTSFCVPLSVQRIPPTDAPVLQTNEGRVVDYDSWNRLSSYIPSQDGTVKLVQNLADSEQTLEVALDHFNENANKPDGRKKALSLLSRALEADPNSVVLWVVYLHIYYRKEKAIGMDDMFSHAVQHNEDSYELWLMYINSRTQLVDRMNAYDNALSVFCHRAIASEKERKHISACFLDLFLQMVQFSCMNGDADKAIMKICGLSQFETDIEITGQISFPHILSSLTLSDRCIFWICCIYVVVYRKLPDAIVQQFELEKDLPFEIEWPSTHLATDEKNRALELMRVALKTVALDTNGENHGKDFVQKTSLRSAHCLVVSHIKCVLALQGLELTADMLAKYMKLYPTCTELVSISVRLQKVSDEEVRFEVFEEALRNWPKEIPGVQCLWNHYAQFALENRRNDFAEELMLRWFNSFCKGQDPGRRELEDEELCTSSEFPPLIPDVSSFPKSNDDMFVFLNLCIHRLLQKNTVEAHVAVDKALRRASPEDFEQCTREHAAFILSSNSVSLKDISDGGILSLLNNYLGDVRSTTILEPLSRRFHQNIKKPRVRQLINNLLGPVSLNCSFMNSILEVWYGPKLLPEEFDEPKKLVDYVEPLMEIMPANYRLALSACKLIIKNFNNAGFASVSVIFWASSLLVNAIFQTFPVAPEQVWLEAANILGYLEIQSISEKFHQHALSVYPFSIELWKSYFNLSKMIGNAAAVVEAARERGIELS